MDKVYKKNQLHGWVVVDKPLGLTSADIVRIVKRKFNVKKVGHGGTLDPMATGILPIAIGEATKTVSYLMDSKKTYTFTVKWGEETDTDDSTGNIINKKILYPNLIDIKNILPKFIGEIDQLPPINGKRAYKISRGGEIPLLSKNKVKIETIKILERISEKEMSFEVICGKGTYVRSLARDFGRCLGTYGHITKLERTAYGPFFNKIIVSIDRLNEINHGIDNLYLLIQPIETVLDDILAVNVSKQEANKLKTGLSIPLILEYIGNNRDAYAIFEKKLIALCKINENVLRPIRVLNIEDQKIGE
jgi:tRNA pseudouridine55 synthase